MYYFFIRLFCLFFILLAAGCSTYHPSTHQYATTKLNKLTPHYVTTQQGQIEYYRAGNGTPIVLIAGYATDVSSWNREFLATLAQHHQIIVPNNRNVGKSKISSASYSSADLANDMYDLIQQLKLKKTAVIGISMGGMIAQQLAVLHPKSVSHLILINTAIAGDQTVEPAPEIKEKLLHLPKYKLGFYLTAVDIFFPAKWKPKMAYSLIADRFQPQLLTEIDPDVVMEKQQALILSWLSDNATAKKLNKLPIPVLVLNGEADVIIPPINSDILANTIPHAQLTRWEDGGHAMIYQYPEDIGNEINHFINIHKTA